MRTLRLSGARRAIRGTTMTRWPAQDIRKRLLLPMERIDLYRDRFAAGIAQIEVGNGSGATTSAPTGKLEAGAERRLHHQEKRRQHDMRHAARLSALPGARSSVRTVTVMVSANAPTLASVGFAMRPTRCAAAWCRRRRRRACRSRPPSPVVLARRIAVEGIGQRAGRVRVGEQARRGGGGSTTPASRPTS